MKRVGIIGLGLMGGALGLAVRRRGLPWRVAASARRAETRELALQRGAADEVFASPRDAVKDADLVVFCLPVLAIPDAIRSFFMASSNPPSDTVFALQDYLACISRSW